MVDEFLPLRQRLFPFSPPEPSPPLISSQLVKPVSSVLVALTSLERLGISIHPHRTVSCFIEFLYPTRSSSDGWCYCRHRKPNAVESYAYAHCANNPKC